MVFETYLSFGGSCSECRGTECRPGYFTNRRLEVKVEQWRSTVLCPYFAAPIIRT